MRRTRVYPLRRERMRRSPLYRYHVFPFSNVHADTVSRTSAARLLKVANTLRYMVATKSMEIGEMLHGPGVTTTSQFSTLGG